MRTLSTAATENINAREGGDDPIFLITFQTDQMATPLRICNRAVVKLSAADDPELVYGLVSRGNTYTAVNFKIILPGESANEAPQASIVIEDATQQMIPLIREAESNIDVTIEMVMPGALNTVEITYDGLICNYIEYNAAAISLNLTFDALTSEPIPAFAFTPAYFPGLF